MKAIPFKMLRPSPAMFISWVGFFTLSMLVYAVGSDGDFSFLLTYAACCRSFGFFILAFRMFASKSGECARHVCVSTALFDLALSFSFNFPATINTTPSF